MTDHNTLPSAVDVVGLTGLSEGHHQRTARSLGVEEVSGHLVKICVLEASDRHVTDPGAALALAAAHLCTGRVRGSLGLALVIIHGGGDGDYVLIHTWIEGYMSDLAVFNGPAGRPDELRPGRTGLAPCVWEAAVLAHERDSFSREILSSAAPLADRIRNWSADVFTGGIT